MTNKIKYIFWCPLCNKYTDAPFAPTSVAIDQSNLEEVQTVIYEQICLDCFHDPDK